MSDNELNSLPHESREGNVVLSQSPNSQSRRSRWTGILRAALTPLWFTNAMLLLGLCAWIFSDPRFGQSKLLADLWIADPLSTVAEWMTRKQAEPLIWAIRSILGIAAAMLALIFAGLFFGAPRHRRMQSWLAFTALVAGWCALATSLPQVAWVGKRWRVEKQIDAFEKIAAALRADWPRDDGTIDALGPFAAYPFGAPRVLFMLAPPKNASGIIERSPHGALRFRLPGAEWNSWLEWHPAGSAPDSFVGGLETRYRLLRSSPLRDGWFLAEYDERPLE